MLCKRLRIYLINRKLKKINKQLTVVPDIKNFLILENERLDIVGKINKLKGKKK